MNPDGVAFIEENHNYDGKTTAIVDKRKNMNPDMTGATDESGCPADQMAVDLNRNYGVDWQVNM